jgi:hypothetical protein
MNATVLYYSSNRESEDFERKIIENLISKSGGMPIVSVTQVPINLGKNICVGPRPHSYTSEFMQIRLGLEAIDTPYVLTAESDFLYPPEYFTFTPEKEGMVYRYWGVWVGTDRFFFKGYSDGAQLVDRKLWLDIINKELPDRDDWVERKKVHCQPARSHKYDEHPWTSDNPVITFKTPSNVNRKTTTKKEVDTQTSLNYWGEINNLKQKLCLLKKT